MTRREGFRILLGLAPRIQHQDVPPPVGRAPPLGFRLDDEWVLLARDGFRSAFEAALFGFEDEAALLVEVDAARTFRTVGIFELHAVFERVAVDHRLRPLGIGQGDTYEFAKRVREALEIRAFRAAGLAPVGDELIDQ